MTQSLFDPTGNDTDRGGSRYLPPEARQASHMPPDLIDGKVEETAVPVDPGLVKAAEEDQREPGGQRTESE